jgi:hypothetical protein
MDQHGKLPPPAFAAAYRKALAGVQNSLGSPGLAPIESTDTGIADQNRRRFIADWPTAS